MSFIRECINRSLPIWESCLKTEFLTKLQNGSLSEDCFKGYMVDDSLYLREYAKVFAYGLLLSQNMEEMKIFYSFLASVNEGEGSTRLRYLKHYGLKDADVQKLPLRPQNQAYINTMHEASKKAHSIAIPLIASLPCTLSYGFIFAKIAKECPQLQNTIFADFLNDYADQSYADVCEVWIHAAEKACANLTESEKQYCFDLFYACSKHEYEFWQMSALPRTDI